MKILSKISPSKIDLVELLADSESPESGGVVCFVGTVRNENKGKKVDHLIYEAHSQLAEKMMEEILTNAINKYNLNCAFAVHRTGKLAIGEAAVAIITRSAHRKEAYQANQEIIHKIKHEAPIWKKEVYSDGSSEWGNSCNC